MKPWKCFIAKGRCVAYPVWGPIVFTYLYIIIWFGKRIWHCQDHCTTVTFFFLEIIFCGWDRQVNGSDGISKGFFNFYIPRILASILINTVSVESYDSIRRKIRANLESNTKFWSRPNQIKNRILTHGGLRIESRIGSKNLNEFESNPNRIVESDWAQVESRI